MQRRDLFGYRKRKGNERTRAQRAEVRKREKKKKSCHEREIAGAI